jgi:hypothetical protein
VGARRRLERGRRPWSELQALFGELPAGAVVERGAGLGIDQHRVAVAWLQGSEERDAVAQPDGDLLRNIVRGEGTVGFVQDPDAGVPEPTVTLHGQHLSGRDLWRLQPEQRVSLDASIGQGHRQVEGERWQGEPGVLDPGREPGIRRGRRRRTAGRGTET